MRWIPLSCAKESDLNWDLPSKDGPPIFWDVDLGVSFPLEEEVSFQALYLALSHFTKSVWPEYATNTAGICLYRGSCDLSDRLHWTSMQEENWESWRAEQPELPLQHLRRLFCRDAFAYYFQKLSHALPDEASIYLLFESVSGLTAAETLQLVSRERYEHFQIATKGIIGWNGLIWDGVSLFPHTLSPCALCFPEEKCLTGALLSKINQLLQQQPLLRVIPEPFLQECWEGVDELYVFAEGLSSQGERKLKGFCAAGGTVHLLNDP